MNCPVLRAPEPHLVALSQGPDYVSMYLTGMHAIHLSERDCHRVLDIADKEYRRSRQMGNCIRGLAASTVARLYGISLLPLEA